jgi:hypothetical protein
MHLTLKLLYCTRGKDPADGLQASPDKISEQHHRTGSSIPQKEGAGFAMLQEILYGGMNSGGH